jgi:putative methyltransferase (TIGR04325 family)
MLRKYVQELIPPAILNLVKYIRRFQITYTTFDEALEDCPGTLGYEDPEFARLMVEETRQYLSSLDDTGFIPADQTTIHTLLPISLFHNRETLNIIDIGGACGIHYFPVKKFLGTSCRLNWSIIETKNLSEAAKVFENEELKFFTNIKQAKERYGKIDIIISSGTIQYFKDPRQILTEITDTDADFILLTRLSLSLSDRDIISVQKSRLSQNGFEILPEGYTDRIIKYPHTNMKESDFLNIIGLKYKIKMKIDDPSGIQRINNYKCTGYALLLEKNK